MVRLVGLEPTTGKTPADFKSYYHTSRTSDFVKITGILHESFTSVYIDLQ